MLQFEQPFHHPTAQAEAGKSNIYKRGASEARSNINLGRFPSQVAIAWKPGTSAAGSNSTSQTGSTSGEVVSSSKGEAPETNVDKNAHHRLNDATPITSSTSGVSSPVMARDSAGKPLTIAVDNTDHNQETRPVDIPPIFSLPPPLKWDWDIEHADRKEERKSDAAFHREVPFEVDRRVLKDVVQEKMGMEVGRIKFISAGTFHKAYLVTLSSHEELVARVARRFMPRLKTESEVATMSYLREKTNVPVPKIYHYDSNPYNRLGGEFILMSKAPGIPLSRVYHSLPYNDLVKLVKNIASILLPLFAHRFSDIGSMYFGPDPRAQAGSGTPTPKATQQHYSGFPFSPTLGAMSKTPSTQSVHTVMHDYHVGPIISWPFFGSNRGELAHPTELDRGPWSSFEAYVESCVDREIKGVVRENEGRSAPHRLHLDPAEIRASRHHRLNAVPGDESDDSDEYSDIEESEEEWEGPGDTMYSDYRRMQRSTFLVAHMSQREEAARKEMDRWKEVMGRLVKAVVRKKDKPGHEQFALDCHDLSVENVFVDPKDHSKITCIIDWESTTTRPLWASAHLPACVQSSPFVSKLFRAAVAELPSDPAFRQSLPKRHGKPIDPTELCREWLFYEAAGARLRMAHRCAEWDGWEEGLVDSILGPEEFESEWFKAGATSYDHEELKAMIAREGEDMAVNGTGLRDTKASKSSSKSSSSTSSAPAGFFPLLEAAPATMLSPTATDSLVTNNKNLSGLAKPVVPLPFVVEEAKEKMLNTTGDYCGGRGGELGLRLEAWLSESTNPNGKAQGGLGVKRWHGDDISASASTMLSPSLEA